MYLLIITNEREFDELKVVQIEDHKVNCAQRYTMLFTGNDSRHLLMNDDVSLRE